MKKKDLKENEAEQPSQNGNGADINIEDNQHSAETVSEPSETEKLQATINELNDKYLRQVAEFENFKRRNAKERIEWIQTAGREVIVDLLEVLDDSERASKQMETSENVVQIREGIQLVFNKLRNTLSSKGLKAMETSGKNFDPDLHEAITEIDAGDEMKGKVVAEIQKGYYLNDKIIRFAKVVVGK